MAKLENVKTIDMTNGEITKVEYNEEIYVRVDGTPAELGDLIQSKKETRDITLGAFYKSISTGDRRPEFYDDVNDHAYLDEEYATVFRKQSASSTTATLDERVSVLESKVATLEGEKDETITHKGAAYTLVDRKAQPGDVVVFTKNTSCCFRNDVVYGPVNGLMEIRDKDGHFMDVYCSFYNRTTDTVKVYEPVAKEQPLKVGDYAKVICERYGHEYSIGDIVELVDDGHKPNFMALRVGDNEDWFVSNEEIVRATDEEVAEAKAEAKWSKIGRKPNEFKKGDIVDTEYYGMFEVSNVDESSDYPIRGIIGGDDTGMMRSGVKLVVPVESRFDRA